MKKLVMLVVGAVAVMLVGCSDCENACNGSPAATCVAQCSDTLGQAADFGCLNQAVAALDCNVNRPLSDEQASACEYSDPENAAYRSCMRASGSARDRCALERSAWDACALNPEDPWCTPEESEMTQAACLECYGYDHPDCE